MIFLTYLLKVIACSGLLYAYYIIALRNKAFHQWNRFYLLFATIVSIIVPLLELKSANVQTGEGLWNTVQATGHYLETIVITYGSTNSSEQWYLLGYALVSTMLLLLLLRATGNLVRLIRTHKAERIKKVNFIVCHVDGTPFSFFNYVFWKPELDLGTKAGRQIFTHELVHVQEKHSLDKLFIQLVIVVFWCNPIFWIIRKELREIHEFIADKKSVGTDGSTDLAALILQTTYPNFYRTLTNQFFQTSIKRRLKMISKINHQRINYFSRLLGLIVLFISAVAFAKTNQNALDGAVRHILPVNDFAIEDTLPGKAYTADEIRSVEVKKDRGIVVVELKDGSRDSMPIEKARKDLNVLPPPAQDLKKDDGNSPLVIMNGNVFAGDLVDINPSYIESINVLKGEQAKEKYGAKGNNGVIEIITKVDRNKEPVPVAVGTSTIDAANAVKDTKHPGITPSNEPLFTKLEKEASVDMGAWRRHLETFLQKHIKAATNNGLKPGQYTVLARFIVEKDGSISDVEVLNSPGYGLGEAVVNLLYTGPKWTPGEQNGRVVRSVFTQPVTFVIVDAK